MEDKEVKQTTIHVEHLGQKPQAIPPDLEDPGPGKAWKRKSDGLIFYGDIYLGYRLTKTGKLPKSPVKETPEDYEVVDL